MLVLIHEVVLVKKTSKLVSKDLFKDFDEVPNVILFGHTHVPMNRHIEKVLFVNPGQGYSSFMVDCTIAELTVRNGEVDSRIITIKKNTP